MTDPQFPSASLYSGGDPDPLARIDEIVGGRYRLLEFIGQGGMGNVYRGEHTTIRKPIALKLLHPSLAGIPELRSRFEREAFAIGRITHPNCVEVSDFGELDDGSLFLAMEYLDGESAADLLDRERPLAPERALQIVRHVLAGLGHAHRVGIVHRDIKPENIFILAGTFDPTFAKVLDFGIAKLLDEADDDSGNEKLTQAGITFGTPAYLSPEQALGDPADARSDLYSVAVVLFELLTGVPPYRSPDKMELLAMHANRSAPSLADAAPLRAFPNALEGLIARGLAKRPAKRFQSAEEFIEAIDALGMFPRPPSASDGGTGRIHPLTPLPLSAPVAHAQTELATPAKRALPWALVLASLAAIAIIGGTISSLSGRVRTLATITKPAASAAAKEAEAHRSDGELDEALEVVGERADDSDSSSQLQAGHAHAAKAEYEKALSAYSRALLLNPNAFRNVELVTNLRLMIDDNGPVYFEALRLLVEYGKGDNDIDRMITLASSSKIDLRKAAFALAQNLNYGDRIDRVQAFLYDLEQEETCEDRRKAVAKLRALGDPRAVEALEAARFKKGKRKRKSRKYTNLNSCLSASARDAARALRETAVP